PYVRAVTVEALLPDQLRISVVEWQPAALLTAGNTSYLLTEVGTVLGRVPPGGAGLPALVVRGPLRTFLPGAHAISGRLLTDLARMRAAFPGDYGLTVTAFEIDAGGRLTA